MAWDATCMAPSHLEQSVMAAGAVASQARESKKDQALVFRQPGLVFTPVAVETSGVLGPVSPIFLKERAGSQSQCHNW